MTRAAVLAGMLAIAVATWACSRRAPLASCDDNLHGIYTADPDERWMLVDHRDSLEAYPLFPDAGGPRDLEVHPRRIDLTRGSAAPSAPATLAGTVHRRYLRRADICEAEVPVHVTRCAGDTLELVLTDPAPPLGFSPCQWPGPAPSRLVRWQRE
jgi:hypothetical protein